MLDDIPVVGKVDVVGEAGVVEDAPKGLWRTKWMLCPFLTPVELYQVVISCISCIERIGVQFANIILRILKVKR